MFLHRSSLRRAILAVFAILAIGPLAAQTSAPAVSGSFSGLVYNRSTGTFNTVLTLTNTGSAPAVAPISVVINTGSSAVTVAGSSDGATLVPTVAGGSIQPGQSITAVVAFSDLTRVAFVPTIKSITATSTPANSVTGQITATSGKISLPNIASADFTGQPALVGQIATIAQATDRALNAAATEVQAALDTDLSNPSSVQITLPVPPNFSVPVVLNATAAFASLTSAQIPVVYLFSTAAGSGDGDDTFEPLQSTVDASAKTVSVLVAPLNFLPNASGSYTLTLKVGVATGSTIAGPTAAPSGLLQSLQSSNTTNSSVSSRVVKLATASAASAPAFPPGTNFLLLNCPLPDIGCTERSRWNPKRVLPGLGSRPHYGLDFVADRDLIYVPSGGHPIQAVNTCGETQADAGCHGGAGNYLTVEYGAANQPGYYKLRLLHLHSIAASMVLPGPDFANTSATTDSLTAVATSGASGIAATSGPHLHYELISPSQPVCYAGGACEYVTSRISGPNSDAFPFMLYSVDLKEQTGQAVLLYPNNYVFSVTATDLNNVAMSSDVQKPQENNGLPAFTPATPYDPTRKICLEATLSGYLTFARADEKATFVGTDFGSFDGLSNSYCAPWHGTSSTIQATSVTTAPSLAVFFNFGSPVIPPSVALAFSADATKAAFDDPLTPTLSSWALGFFPTGTVKGTLALAGPPTTAANHANNVTISIGLNAYGATLPLLLSSDCTGCALVFQNWSPYFWTSPVTGASGRSSASINVNFTGVESADCSIDLQLTPQSSGNVTAAALPTTACEYPSKGISFSLPTATPLAWTASH